ncbi:MAG: polysaccharide deacetylase family protein [Clostridia bacterium]|nr:polysaccharide deacetylase family protein [Clostridia bacterium]
MTSLRRFFLLLLCLSLFLTSAGAAGSITIIRPTPTPVRTQEPRPTATPEPTPEAQVLAGDSDLSSSAPAVRSVIELVPTPEPTPDERPFIIRFGSRDEPKISLTMDDCYNLDAVRDALELCKQYNIVMTFYPLGIMLHEEDRQLWQDIIDAGCEIGTHTMWHSRVARNPETRVAMQQILKPQEVMDQVLGYHHPLRTLRPPYGSIEDANDNISRGVRLLMNAGYKHVVNWDVSQTNPQLALPRVQNGSILLYHARETDVKCISVLIPQLIEKGFTFVTVAELIGLGSEVTTSSDLYVFDPKKY